MDAYVTDVHDGDDDGGDDVVVVVASEDLVRYVKLFPCGHCDVDLYSYLCCCCCCYC